MLQKSKKHNPNYLAKVFRINKIRKHMNADRLQITSVDFQDVVTGLDAKLNDIYVYFPLESKLNSDFLSQTNSYRDGTLNKDPKQTGFFEKNGRIRAVKLRGEKSMGYIVPVQVVFNWAGVNDNPEKYLNEEFDTINGKLLLEKYTLPIKTNNRVKQGKKPQLTRLIDGQVHLHVDTENLRKNAYKIHPEDNISVTYKEHGTSFWVSNVLVKRKLSLFDKVLLYLGVNVNTTEYDVVYGSRKVVKNRHFEDSKRADHYYDYDIWGEAKEELKDKVLKGISLYGEIVGFTKNGQYIQNQYDYGCSDNEHKLKIYRITYTNPDGEVFEFNYSQIKEYCERFDLTPVHSFYEGKAKDLYPQYDTSDVEKWRGSFIRHLEANFNEKNCFMCKNNVPEEGVVVRKDKLFGVDVFKLKSFKFLEFETKLLDKGIENIEDN